ncbi:MAG: DUF624 domain-containing protein [Clostridia bacterium]|nr:DUF624 domain-containing protein [Clostridia bacterium]NCC42765.1 DUF624 domain-containing protein [Clostridia bacterium]
MSNLFNQDNKFFTFMGRVADLIILNILCIICCLPVVTAGASITAMYYVTLKMVRNEESYIVKGFFHSFKQNLKQGIVIHLIMLLVGGVLAFDLYFMNAMRANGTVYTVFTYVFMVAIAVYLMIFVYIYPTLSKFFNSVKNTFRNSLLMSIRHLPYTILMLLITFVPLASMFTVPKVFAFMLMFYFLMGFAVVSLANSFFLAKIFDKYIPEKTEDEEENKTSDDIDGSVFKNLSPISAEEAENASKTDEAADSSDSVDSDIAK